MLFAIVLESAWLCEASRETVGLTVSAVIYRTLIKLDQALEINSEIKELRVVQSFSDDKHG